MKQKLEKSTFGPIPGRSRQEEEKHLADTLAIVRDNVADYTAQVRQMGAEIDEMLERYHDNDAEVLTLLNNTVTLHSHMKKTLEPVSYTHLGTHPGIPAAAPRRKQ